MKATEFEFRYRALLIALIYFVGFWLYAFDHVSVIYVLARWIEGAHAEERVLAAKLLAGFAALLIGFGALVRTWGAAYLQSSVVHDAKLHSMELVADGPYRHVRHPLYFASIVANIGVALMASRSGFLFIVIVMTPLYLRLAGREDKELEESQGERYREFARRVPRLWPSIRTRVAATGAKPRWGQAFFGEVFMWLFTGAVAVYAITLNLKLLWWVIGAAVVFLFAETLVHNRRRRKAAAAA
ncbi:MAG TPA: isoprenylcysteine carboxylmethyltransferase family protein [Candidatus Dormibacteraeota bacterium]|nr:isoprenylcysteine carboxylmethyltransferase family protein [Candidatus Dormibacteraeota bacterium]